MSIIIKSLNTININAKQFLDKIGTTKVFTFNGEMGVGKTTFIKAICKELGVEEIVNSPTFAIVNEYKGTKNETIYHFDCYRINKIEEALEIGIEEYLYSGAYCFIEWAENIASLLPDDIKNVYIDQLNDGTRIIKIDD